MSNRCTVVIKCCEGDGPLKVASSLLGGGGLPGNEAVSKIHNLFMFVSSRFCPSDRSKTAFLRPYHGSRGGPNLILRSSNIPQSNITRLRSYHIQRERAIFSHHSSLLSLFQASINAGLFFFLSQGFHLLLDRMKGLQSSADAQFHHEAGGSSKSVLWGK